MGPRVLPGWGQHHLWWRIRNLSRYLPDEITKVGGAAILFHSLQFVCLYAITLVLFLLTKGAARRYVLLAASVAFYAGGALHYLGLLVLVALISYQGALGLSRVRSKGRLLGYVGACVAPLALFKLGELAGVSFPSFGSTRTEIARATAIPIGISFYTLQAISYLVDVYRRARQPTRDLGTHALYLAFFPQLLAGPIERATRLVPQLRTLPTPTGEDLYVGAKIMLWGYFCKLVIADNVAGIVDRILLSYAQVTAASLPISLYLYSFQIYFDFFGYTMIAIGLGRTFGIRLSQNFDRPYLAGSLREFWRRWHITLSSWLRDYVYIPLGGRRAGYGWFVLAIVVTFIVSGLWHGAAVNFILWGGVHAGMFVLADATAGWRRRWLSALPKSRFLGWTVSGLRVWFCFSAVSLAWLFFRVEDLGQITAIIGRMIEWVAAGAPFQLAPVFFQVDTLAFLLLLVVAFALDSTGVIRQVTESVPQRVPEISRELATVNFMLVSLLLLGDLGSRAFIYFRF